MIKKRAGFNILVDQNGYDITAILYDTVIYRQKENEFQLKDGGFKTGHTKNCMNDLLPDGYFINQRKGQWLLTTPDGIIDYKNNMTVRVYEK